MSDKVIYLGPFSFPNGGAAARRILGIARALQEAKFEVKVACGQMSSHNYSSEWFEGIEVFSLNERTAERLPRQLKHLAYLTMGRKTVVWLDSLNYKPHTIILYSGYSPYLLHLLPWARTNKVRLVFDAVEWYDPASRIGWFSPYQLNIELAMRLLLPRVGFVISISSYLNNYYIGRGCRSIVVPPTLDVFSTASRANGRELNRPLELVYAGSPGRKDLLDNIVEAVLRLYQAGHALHLSVAGITRTKFEEYSDVLKLASSDVSACIEFLGTINHAESINLVRKADFSILLRNDARYSRAGFPTKFVESFALGTPVIANLTSDLHLYLTDGETGFICKGPNPEDLELELLRALKLTSEQHAAMRLRCRALALKAFDYRAYVAPLSHLLKSH